MVKKSLEKQEIFAKKTALLEVILETSHIIRAGRIKTVAISSLNKRLLEITGAITIKTKKRAEQPSFVAILPPETASLCTCIMSKVEYASPKDIRKIIKLFRDLNRKKNLITPPKKTTRKKPITRKKTLKRTV